ncbi:MAG TPA: ComF family protein [Streptococcus sp.]|nr:ComF family protein [Streptococcus sp.]
MKCLLCNDWIESVPKLRDLIMFNQRKECFCVSCKNQYKKLSKERCQNCNKELHRDACIDCKLWMKKGYVPKHLAIYRYEENMRECFSRYKFMGDYCLRKIFQQDIKNTLKPFLKKGYTIVPVPLSKERLAERGFNQVEGLIEGIPYRDIFEKRDIEKQSSKTRDERLSQDNAFCLKKGINVPDKIIIVDDIYTTGSTLYQMVQLLEGIGIKEVLTFSLAR